MAFWIRFLKITELTFTLTYASVTYFTNDCCTCQKKFQPAKTNKTIICDLQNDRLSGLTMISIENEHA